MENFIYVISVLGAFWGAVTVYKEVTKASQRFILLGCSVLMVCGVYLFSVQNAELDRIQSIERQAALLVKNHGVDYGGRGFAMATLAFLEKNEKDFPDLYLRAQQLCELHKCMAPESRYDLTDLQFTLAGMLRGIAQINSESEPNG